MIMMILFIILKHYESSVDIGFFSNNILSHPDLVFTDTGPDESEEEEVNENIIYDE